MLDGIKLDCIKEILDVKLSVSNDELDIYKLANRYTCDYENKEGLIVSISCVDWDVFKSHVRSLLNCLSEK